MRDIFFACLVVGFLLVDAFLVDFLVRLLVVFLVDFLAAIFWMCVLCAATCVLTCFVACIGFVDAIAEPVSKNAAAIIDAMSLCIQ
ncbi:MAG: hypothetical protein JO233_07195 [Candidatus Eremiobacteraeota bacterium]|nr:hypothetical protein [Candidatus Eremiobacteraeota bacterium]